MIEPKTHTIEQPGAPREVSSQPAADEELPSSAQTSAGPFRGRYETQFRRCLDNTEALAHILRS
jgi:hypothetical protein